MKSKTKLISIILLVALASCVVTYAVMVAYRSLDTTITIVAVYDMELYEMDKTTLLTSVDFGVLTRGQGTSMPGDGDRYWIQNTGDGEIWIKLETVDWPADTTLLISYTSEDGGFMETNLEPGVITTNSIAPGAFQAFFLSAQASATAAFGTYNPTLTLSAHDTASG